MKQKLFESYLSKKEIWKPIKTEAFWKIMHNIMIEKATDISNRDERG